jgi:hypothetical protein
MIFIASTNYKIIHGIAKFEKTIEMIKEMYERNGLLQLQITLIQIFTVEINKLFYMDSLFEFGGKKIKFYRIAQAEALNVVFNVFDADTLSVYKELYREYRPYYYSCDRVPISILPKYKPQYVEADLFTYEDILITELKSVKQIKQASLNTVSYDHEFMKETIESTKQKLLIKQTIFDRGYIFRNPKYPKYKNFFMQLNEYLLKLKKDGKLSIYQLLIYYTNILNKQHHIMSTKSTHHLMYLYQ